LSFCLSLRSLFLLVPLSTSRYPLIMTVHAVYALTGLGKYEFVNPISADFALETVRVVRVVAGHDSFVKNGKFADIAAVGTVGADGGTVGQQEQVSVCCDFVVAFSALETVDVEERLSVEREDG
jgi:hypothetical protein